MSAPVTEAHRGLAQNIVFYHTPKGSSTAQGVRDAAQLIANSEARATYQLRAEVERLKRDYDYDHKCLYEVRERCELWKQRAERAEAELKEWSLLNLWGGTPEIVHAFVKGQQARIHAAQDVEAELAAERTTLAGVIEIKRGVEAELAEMKRMLSSEKLMYKLANDSAIKHEWAAGELRNELAAERAKVRVLKLDKDRLDWWNGESYYQFGKSHKCMNPGWWWSCGFDQIQGKSGIKNIRDAIDSAMAHSKSGRNKYNVCDRIEKSSTENKP